MPSYDHIIPAGKWLAGAVLAASLSGCLSGGGGSSDTPPSAEQPAPTNPLLRATSYGPIEGVDETAYFSFRGIPYAAPPVGDLRFAAPVAPQAWSETRAATNFAAQCPQASGGSEDCLYLNVFTPKTKGPHPVMVWIHGGAFTSGSGGITYTPIRMVSHDVVVVTLNYRLGRLGFLAHPGLSAESDGNSGSYGIMDQQLALKWVQANIDTFGGDPDNVTIFGESAGGMSVLSNLISPAADGLFDKVIVQSGSYSMVQDSQDAAASKGSAFADALGCDAVAAEEEVACLRSKGVADILSVPVGNLTPSLRADILPTSVAPALATRKFPDVPVIAGTNSDEWAYFVADSPVAIDQNTYQPYLTSLFGPALAAAIVQAYPVADYGNDYAKLVTAAGTDGIFACNAVRQADWISSGVSSEFYAYEFADRAAPEIRSIPSWLRPAGAAHAFELQYLFGSDATFRARGASDDQIALANVMTRAWTDFAKAGDPSSTDGTFVWPAYSTAGNMVSFVPPSDETLSKAAFRAAHRCDFWGALGQ